jgi:hypothetical protein
MPFSKYWNLVEVTGHYVGSDGSSIEGFIIFTPTPARMVDAGALTTIIGRPMHVQLDANGSFRFSVPATDDPDITPIDFTYEVREDFPGGATYGIEVPLLYAGIGLDIAEAAHIAPNTGVVAGVTREEFDELVATVDTLENYDGGWSDSVYAGEVDGGGANLGEDLG